MKKMLFTNNWLYQYVLLIILLFSGFVTVGYAASVPNVFTSGTVAKSSEVNENFNYLTDRSWELNGNDVYYNKGYVGIGTTSPLAPLHVSSIGWVGIDVQSLTNGGSYLNFADADDRNAGSVLYDHASNQMEFKTDDATRIVITNTGMVGIGTHTPSEKLHIKGTDTWGTVVLVTDTTNNVDTQIRSMGEYELGVIGTVSNHDLHLSTNGNTKMVIKTDGNVGIGTTEPEVHLDILDTASGAYLRLKGAGDSYNFAGISLESDEATDKIWAISQRKSASQIYKLGFQHFNGAQWQALAMVMQPDGKIGIGTDSPAGKLDVNGSIYQRGSNLHADYVFEKEYTLESIEEHSKYMWENKHLKAIPKAKVDQSGQEIVEVGAHRKGIVEELEKAHIYIEQLHKRINEMEGLKAKNETLVSKLLIRIEALENNK